MAHLARNSRRVYADRGRGILERSVSVWFDGAAYHRVLARLVRGLHWVESSRILPLKAKITTSPVCQLPVEVMPHIRDLAASVPTKWLNDSTVAYKAALYSKSGSVWLFEFFGAHQAYAHVSDDDAEQLRSAI